MVPVPAIEYAVGCARDEQQPVYYMLLCQYDKYAFSAHMRYILYYVWAASLYRVLLISRDGCYSAAADVRVYNGRFLCVFFSPSLIGTCGGHAHAAESQKRFR